MNVATMNSEMPMKLNAASSSAVVSPDKLSVKGNQPFRQNTAQSLQSNKPVPINIGSVYYFEMRVKNAGYVARAAIGYTQEGFDLSKYIGSSSEPNSVGYHGDDGKIWGSCASVCPKFTTNDIVGAGMNYASNEFFFTKNGELVGAVSKKIDGPFFPTISVFDSDVEVKVNFGHKPFAYAIETKYPYPYYHRPENFDTKPSSSSNESLKKLIKENESLLMKSLEEKEKEVASLKAVIKALRDNFLK